MSTLKSSAESLILNADGSGNDVIIQSDGSTKAIVTAEGTVGIGTTSPSVALEIYGDSGGDEMALKYSGTAGSHTSKYLFKDFRGQSNAGIYNHLENDGDGTAAARLEFHTATGGTMTKRMTIQSGGDVTVENGDIVFGTAGKGICLGATSNTDANTLDDYEEGTWTPTITCSTSGSYTVDTGANALAYTKVGRVVHIQGGVNIASESSPNGNIRMSLPFTPFSGTKDSDYCMGNAMLTNHGGSLPNNADLFISGADYASLFSVADDGGTQYLDHDDVDTAFTIIFSMTYIAS